MRDRQTITDEVETILDKPVLDQTDVAHSQKLVIELLLDIREMKAGHEFGFTGFVPPK